MLQYQVFLEFLKELGRHGLYHQYLTLPEPYNDTKNVRGHLIAVLKPSGLKLGLKKSTTTATLTTRRINAYKSLDLFYNPIRILLLVRGV